MNPTKSRLKEKVDRSIKLFMEIVFIAAEMAPFAKVGGLGDVIFGLSRALLSQGHAIEVILPKYDSLYLDDINGLEVFWHDFRCTFNGVSRHHTLWKGEAWGVKVTLIESHDPRNLFNRKTIYGCEDDPIRFAHFSKLALEYLAQAKRTPEIIHSHDWHASFVPPLLKKNYLSTSLSKTRSVFTFHNLSYQGVCPPEVLKEIDLEIDGRFHDPFQPNLINLLKAAIEFSDFITTVSPTYAKEVVSTEEGMGLNETLLAHGKKFKGILNGIDCGYWNPSHDPYLAFHFSSAMENYLEVKERNKMHLRAVLSLNDTEAPIVSTVTRLVYQKAPFLIRAALEYTLEVGAQFILVGVASDPETAEEFLTFKRELAESKDIHLELSYNEQLSHLVYAGSDIFVIPSLFEPCGLTQMIAMNYGTVPIARKTGGLADTVFEEENGFLFQEPNEESLRQALHRAFLLYKGNRASFDRLRMHGIRKDFSWDASARHYLEVYKHLQLL